MDTNKRELLNREWTRIKSAICVPMSGQVILLVPVRRADSGPQRINLLFAVSSFI